MTSSFLLTSFHSGESACLLGAKWGRKVREAGWGSGRWGLITCRSSAGPYTVRHPHFQGACSEPRPPPYLPVVVGKLLLLTQTQGQPHCFQPQPHAAMKVLGTSPRWAFLDSVHLSSCFWVSTSLPPCWRLGPGSF